MKSEIQKSKIQNVPIVAMTADAMAGDEEKSLAAGINDYINKPIDLNQLYARLHKRIAPIDKRAQIHRPQVSAKSFGPDPAVPALRKHNLNGLKSGKEVIRNLKEEHS